jgi:hypothetical protein
VRLQNCEVPGVKNTKLPLTLQLSASECFVSLSSAGRGESIFTQVITGGALDAVMISVIVIAASFAPAVLGRVPWDEAFNKKEPSEQKSFAFFTPLAEIQNGRAAMLVSV